jgi:hypothetical protein
MPIAPALAAASAPAAADWLYAAMGAWSAFPAAADLAPVSRSPHGGVLEATLGLQPVLSGDVAASGDAAGRGREGWARDGGPGATGAVNAMRLTSPIAFPATALAGEAGLIALDTGAREASASSRTGEAMPTLMAQIVRAARLAWTQLHGEAHLTVDAGGVLGEVRVSLHVSRGQVWATLHTDRAAVQQVLDAARSDLQRGLAEHGLGLHRFAVSVNPDGRRRSAPGADRWDRRSGSRHTGPRFEDVA